MDGFPPYMSLWMNASFSFAQFKGFSSLLTQPLLWLPLIQHICVLRAQGQPSMTHSLTRFRAVSMGSSFIQPTHTFVCSGDVGHYEERRREWSKLLPPGDFSLEKRQTWAHLGPLSNAEWTKRNEGQTERRQWLWQETRGLLVWLCNDNQQPKSMISRPVEQTSLDIYDQGLF